MVASAVDVVALRVLVLPYAAGERLRLLMLLVVAARVQGE